MTGPPVTAARTGAGLGLSAGLSPGPLLALGVVLLGYAGWFARSA
ncbi:MAG: hypothetical protein P4L39_07465 [Humidesulfovibrio sp.]|nr:hypothetical protein [Humidesulfovibrio sp.]